MVLTILSLSHSPYTIRKEHSTKVLTKYMIKNFVSK